MANVYITFTGPEGGLGAFRRPAGGADGKRGGTFVGASYNRLRPLYTQLAEELKNEVSKTILAERSVRDKNPRKKNPKGTLAKVTRDQRNSKVTNEGFAVGSHVYLARSAAKYYRIIEEGSASAAPSYATSMIPGSWRGDQPTGYIIPRSAEPRSDLPRQDIAPLRAYTRAWHDINASGKLRKMWRQVLVDADLVSPRGGPLPKRFDLGNIDY